MSDPESQEAVEVRKMVGDGAREYLEEQSVRWSAHEPARLSLTSHIDQVHGLCRKDAREPPGRGGARRRSVDPEQDPRIPQCQVPKERPVAEPGTRGAFRGIFSGETTLLTASRVQIANNTPVWARIYYLLRSGHAKEALAFATENESALQKLEKSFLSYFKAWLDAPDRRLPKLLRDRFLAEYNQRIRYSTDRSDPYKHALYKLIGRVEINRRNVAGVTQTTEDWLWFQLSLVRETEGQGEAPHEKYGLRDLAAVLLKFGEAHFDPKGTRPLLYFQVLLLSGQFERVRSTGSPERHLMKKLTFELLFPHRPSRSCSNTRSTRLMPCTLPSPCRTTACCACRRAAKLPTSSSVSLGGLLGLGGRVMLTLATLIGSSGRRQERDAGARVLAASAPLHALLRAVGRGRGAAVPVPDLPKRRLAGAARGRADRGRASVRARARDGDEAVQSAAR